jgi:hypothetical protein
VIAGHPFACSPAFGLGPHSSDDTARHRRFQETPNSAGQTFVIRLRLVV